MNGQRELIAEGYGWPQINRSSLYLRKEVWDQFSQLSGLKDQRSPLA